MKYKLIYLTYLITVRNAKSGLVFQSSFFCIHSHRNTFRKVIGSVTSPASYAVNIRVDLIVQLQLATCLREALHGDVVEDYVHQFSIRCSSQSVASSLQILETMVTCYVLNRNTQIAYSIQQCSRNFTQNLSMRIVDEVKILNNKIPPIKAR